MVGRFLVSPGRRPGTVDRQPSTTRARLLRGGPLVAVARPVPAVDRPVAVDLAVTVAVAVLVVVGRGMSIPVRC